MSSVVGRVIVAALRGLLTGYRLVVSPLLGPRCRFYPSCSRYAHDALGQHGLVRGGGLALRRIVRCHPWHPGGIDPVPASRDAAVLAGEGACKRGQG